MFLDDNYFSSLLHSKLLSDAVPKTPTTPNSFIFNPITPTFTRSYLLDQFEFDQHDILPQRNAQMQSTNTDDYLFTKPPKKASKPPKKAAPKITVIDPYIRTILKAKVANQTVTVLLAQDNSTYFMLNEVLAVLFSDRPRSSMLLRLKFLGMPNTRQHYTDRHLTQQLKSSGSINFRAGPNMKLIEFDDVIRLKTSISMVSKMKRGVKAERKSHLKDVQALIDCFYQRDYTLSEKLNILQDLFKKKSQDSSSDLSK